MMAEKRRNYPEEFKREAIRLVTEQGYGVAETARNLGINANMLGRWKRECDTQASTACPGNGRMTSEKEELPRLRSENKRLRMERAMLKKALGFFANGSNGGMALLPSISTRGQWPSFVRCSRSAAVGLMRICHATHAVRLMRSTSSW